MLAAVLVLALTACGGGGGGSGEFTPTAQSLRFDMDPGEGTPPQTIDVVTPELEGTSHASVLAGPGLRVEWSLSPAGVLVTVYPLWGVPEGNPSYIDVRLCADAMCNQVRHTQRVPVVVVEPLGLLVATGRGDLVAAALGRRPATLRFALTLPNEPGQLSIGISDYLGQPVPWLQARQAGAQLEVSFEGAELLAKGSFSGNIVLRYERSNGKTAFKRQLDMTLEVDDAGCRPLNGPSPSQQVGGPDRWEEQVSLWPVSIRCYGAYNDQVRLSSTLAGLSLTWSVTEYLLSDFKVQASLSPDWVAGNLANRQSHAITWTVSAPGLEDYVHTAPIDLYAAEVIAVQPTRISAGQAREVTLQLSAVLFDNPLHLEGVGEISYRIDNCSSDRCDVVAALPALAAGRYTLSLRSEAIVMGHQPVVIEVVP